ncbi:hypothetical protein TrST_g9031 [Triparma strigata]|uniref:Uncharacterized protein n=1 Tax=Triparma strigata TaxID=1606541 RepID=A0A9W6ZSU4_9STRA|nr:hypothetical protein TrST_g9031 [Triparma strigata]
MKKLKKLHRAIINFLFTEEINDHEPSFYDSGEGGEDSGYSYSIRDTSRYAQDVISSVQNSRSTVGRQSSRRGNRVSPQPHGLSVTDTSRFAYSNENDSQGPASVLESVSETPGNDSIRESQGGNSTAKDTSRFAYANESSQGPASVLESERASQGGKDTSRFAYANESSQGPASVLESARASQGGDSTRRPGTNLGLTDTSRFTYENENSQGPASVLRDESARQSGGGLSSIRATMSIVEWKPAEQVQSRSEFYTSVYRFIVETGAFSMFSTLIPILYIYVLDRVAIDTMEYYLGEDSDLELAKLRESNTSSIVVLPAANAYRLMYYTDPQGSTPQSLDVATIGYWIAVVAPNYIRAQIIFPSKNRFGSIICFLLSVALCWLLSFLHVIEKEYQAKYGCASSTDPTKGVNPAIALVSIPLLFVVSFYNSGFYLAKDPRKNLSLYYICFLFQLVEIVIAFVYTWVFLPVFFDSSSDVVRFSIRIFGSLVTVKIMVEVIWRVSARCVTDFGVDLQDAPILVLTGANTLPLLARLMQGSAETVEKSILYEIAGTLAELNFADCLLKGRTPLLHYSKNIKWLYHLLSRLRKNKSRVAPEGEPEEEAEGEVTEEEDELSIRDKIRIIFCETTMVVFMIAEASALVISTAFWLMMTANPSDPGSEAIAESQTYSNFVIMLIGECFVTDGIIAILSHHLTSRFKVDLPATWTHMKKCKKKMLVAIVATISLNSFVCLAPVGTTLCFTHRVTLVEEESGGTGRWPDSDYDDFVMTSCPPPPNNVTEYAWVGAQFYEEWKKFYRGSEAWGEEG